MKGMKGICKGGISATWPLGEKSPGEDRIALDGKMLRELERDNDGRVGDVCVEI